MDGRPTGGGGGSFPLAEPQRYGFGFPKKLQKAFSLLAALPVCWENCRWH
jgi:hypothetical protein